MQKETVESSAPTASTQAQSGEPYFTEEEVNAHVVTEGYFTALDALSKGAFLKMPNVLLYETHDNEPDYQFSTRALAGLTICVLVLKNGFTVTGTSICMDYDKFDALEGRKRARAQAITQLVPYLAFALRTQRQAELQAQHPPTVAQNFTEVIAS